MTDNRPAPAPKPPGKAKPQGLDPRLARIGALAVWLVSGLGFLLVADLTAMDRLTLGAIALAAFTPAIIVSLGLLVAAATWSLSRETHHLQGAVDELRRVVVQREAETAALSPVAQSRLEDLKSAQEETDTRLTMFFSQRTRPPSMPSDAPAPPDQQATFPLDSDAQTTDAPLPPADLIRALNFPENEDDAEGFHSLRRALSDPRIAPLIRAAQDVLTRLAQEGIYMDDLRPDRARPEFWRAFAQGTRGPMIAPLGGIRDRSCLAITSGRMRSDPEFRASAHLFLREFDRVFSAFTPQADDSQITAIADTRSARAFMLVGRVSGVFSR
ncbi:hypothetical protein LY56_00759 [Roseinatronobacter thiooxidans]|uniref:Uncharacterized protein n=1 Tax=Roseinatronobacter thiooxidans TaxID=121821 RepID=A0A2W7QXX7_9RHOB|nr:hypothetical protein [Roseinatronobacter thiooxidans]PZX46559.1 hypothetical protein LY56_00759 [Roseinatronobacter thiooxidans]